MGIIGGTVAYKLLRKIEGMGLGDVKMMAMIGAVIGWEPLLPMFILASASGAVVGLVVASKSGQGMQAAIPFGVFLGLAFLFVLLFGTWLWPAYLDLLVPGLR